MDDIESEGRVGSLFLLGQRLRTNNQKVLPKRESEMGNRVRNNAYSLLSSSIIFDKTNDSLKSYRIQRLGEFHLPMSKRGRKGK